MKKLLIVLLALTVLGGFAIAQDAPKLAFSGSVSTGFHIASDKDANLSAFQYESNNPSNGTGYFDAAIATAKSGAFAEFVVAGDVPAVTQDSLYGWWKPAEMVKVLIGYGVGSYYKTPIEGWKTSTTGMQIQLDPIPGLQLSAEYQAGALPGAKFDASKNISFDASYAMKDMFKVGLDYDTAGKVLVAGLDVMAVPNLTAQADFRYTDGTKKTEVEENFAYAMGAMKPSLWAFETKVDTADMTWGVKPGFAYAMEGWTPSGYFEYDSDKTWHLTAQADATVEQIALRGAFTYNDNSSWDLGLRFVVSF
jgi:opacity protein-like surface antigen